MRQDKPLSHGASRAAMDLKALVREVPDFPKKGILFKDLTPVWQDPAAFRSMVEQMAEPFRASQVELIAGIESRGLIIGSALALELGAGLVPVRKEGKLPWKTVRASYSLEYGEAVTELHRDAFKPGARVLIVDDLLATGGTAQAAVQLVKELEGKIVGLAFLVELEFLQGRQKLEKLGVDLFSLIKYT